MTEHQTDDQMDPGANPDGEPDIASLRNAANKSKRLERENAELRRNLAFTQAGIDTNDPRLQYFAKGYEGELTAEAIKAEATKAGFLAPPEPTPEEQAQQAQQQQAQFGEQQIAQAAAGAIPPGQMDPSDQLVGIYNDGGAEAVLNALRAAGVPISTDAF